jgi:tetratricopeptide (TPR) repeat protein
MQDRLSSAVIGSLSLRMPARSGAVIAPRDLEAFEYYARGRRLWQRLEKGTFDQAGELYEKAIRKQPDFAPALSGLAALHAMRFTFTTDPDELQKASTYARRAIAADSSLSDPHIWLGYALMRQDLMDEALAEELQGAALDPGAHYAPYFAGCVELFRGRATQALPHFQQAVKLDPSHGFGWIGLGSVHTSLGNLKEAKWCVERAIALENTPGSVPTAGAGGLLGECLRLAGHLDEARAACMEGIETAEKTDHMYRDTFRTISLCALGRAALAQADSAAARAAFTQTLAHLRGRPRTLGGGYLAVQALAGLARAGEGQAPLIEARQLFERRDRFNFSLLWTCDDATTLVELARAARLFSEPYIDLLLRARDRGSYEARRLLEEEGVSA